MNRIVNAFFLTLLGAAFLITAAHAQSSMAPAKSSAGTPAMDTTFMKKAAQGGMAEVELGQLAVQKAASDDVKKFGQRMVDDHTKANDQLKQIAGEEHVTLPRHLNAKDSATKASLEKLSGTEFDRAYMHDMVKDHKQDVAEFQKESNSAQNTGVKNFAAQTLPTLKDHLKEAERIASSQGASARVR
ncbi:MAG TPA: DUF4142 domain-containing protein [Candidatus Sulfotelmatobacter sp.]|jgi:putative membrane protein